ncbi:MAG: putative quinol monooxygenase [Hyphomicrobiales bacterium]
MSVITSRKRIVTVIAKLRAKTGCQKQLKDLLESFISPTYLEAGIIKYEVLQNIEDPYDFFVLQEWEKEDDHFRHLQSNHIQKLVEVSFDILEEWEIYRAVKTRIV